MSSRRAVRFLLVLVLFLTGMPFSTVAQVPAPSAPWFVEGDVSYGRIALVFNMGIGSRPSERILDTLIGNDVDATMFPMGPFARSNPDYLRRLDAAGFAIGTHGDSGIALTQASDDAIRADLRASIVAIEAVVGRPIEPYHTPYAADTNERVRAVVASEGLLLVGWKVTAPDWGPDATEKAVYRAVVDNVYPGAIVEMHLDGPGTDVSTARALPRIVDDLRARGYEFVTIGEMTQPCPGTPRAVPETITLTGLDVHGLHCKVAPDQGARMIRLLQDGETIPVRGPVFDDWLPVTCAGQDGWIRAGTLRGLDGPPQELALT